MISVVLAWAALFGRLLLAAVFVVAAVGKLADRQGSQQALVDFGGPRWLAAPAALLLPLVEVAVAVLLLPGVSARWGAVGALALLGLFSAGIAVSLARGRRPDCHCFGQLHSEPVGASTLARNGILMGIAGLVLWQGGGGPALSVGAGTGLLPWLAVGAGGLALLLAVGEAWFLAQLIPAHGRLLMRVDALERALGRERFRGVPVGEEAPAFTLPAVNRSRVSLSALRAAGRPVMLLFTNPDCPPCDELMPDVARWQTEHADRVTIAAVSRGPLEAARRKAEQFGLQTVVVQREVEVSAAYQIEGTPAAVLVGPDGRVASPIANGAPYIGELLQRVLDGAADDSYPSADGGEGHGHRHAPLVPGQPAPALVLPDLDGRTVDLADRRGAPTLVVFWSPTCGFCQQMLPELKAWERRRPAGTPDLLIVSSGPAEANRALGLTSSLVLDTDGSVMRDFGASGTPMALLVDADGRIASPLVVGARELMTLAKTRPRVAALR